MIVLQTKLAEQKKAAILKAKNFKAKLDDVLDSNGEKSYS